MIGLGDAIVFGTILLVLSPIIVLTGTVVLLILFEELTDVFGKKP